MSQEQNAYTVKECLNDEDIMSSFSVMSQLRPKIQKEKYCEMVKSLMKSEGYRLVGLYNKDGQCLAAAGFITRRCLFGGGLPELYVDDLVTDETHRSQGLGKTLFNWLKIECKRLDYKGIILDSGKQRVEAHRFYEREGMQSTALHFYRERSPSPERRNTGTIEVGSQITNAIPQGGENQTNNLSGVASFTT